MLGIREITPEELAEVLRGCGLESAAELVGGAGADTGEPVAAAATTALREIELGTEADAPFVALSGGSDAANARILAIVNAVNGIYEADLALTNRVVAHEEGHNLGADHGESGVMAPTLDPDATWFSDASRSQIAAYTAGTSCLAEIASGRPPLLEPVGPQGVVEGGVLELALAASDPDGDPLVFGATPLLPGAEMSPDGRFRWAPPFTTAGCGASRVVGVEFFVSDGSGNRASESVPITVGDAPTGATPVLVDPADRSVRAGESLVIALSASDADGDTLAFSAPALPPGAGLSDSGVFSWRPTNADAGIHALSFVVTDCSGRSASHGVSIRVDAVAPPHLDALAPDAGAAGAQVEIAGSGLAGGTVEVLFGAKPAAVYALTDTRLVVLAPSQRKNVSQVSVRVVRDGIASDNALPFTYRSAKGGGRRAR